MPAKSKYESRGFRPKLAGYHLAALEAVERRVRVIFYLSDAYEIRVSLVDQIAFHVKQAGAGFSSETDLLFVCACVGRCHLPSVDPFL